MGCHPFFFWLLAARLPAPLMARPHITITRHALPAVLPEMTACEVLLQDLGHGQSVTWYFPFNESLSHSFFLPGGERHLTEPFVLL